MNAANSTKTKEVTMYPDGRVDTHNASAYVGLSEKTMEMFSLTLWLRDMAHSA